jgi:hypothetical protein
MSLKFVLWLKIIVTAVLWAFPLLLASPWAFRQLGFPEPGPMVFFKLLGAAFLALGVGYVRGLLMLNGGRYPADAVLVGKVSNGLACALIVIYGLTGTYTGPGWEWPARAFMWLSAGLTGFVTLGLFVAKR